MSERKKLVIDRNTWLRGEGSDSSFLLRKSDGKMCCLGFAAMQLAGAEQEMIENVSSPDDCPYDGVEIEMPWLFDSDHRASVDCQNLMNMNDRFSATAEERKDFIKQVFEKHGVDVEFVN